MAKMKALILSLSFVAAAQPLAAQAWTGYGNNGQHTGDSTVAGQALTKVNWSTSVDQVYSVNPPGTLYIHYGSPSLTTGNTILVPQRTTSDSNYQVNAFSAGSGAPKYTLATDYTPPPHNWIPSFGPVLTPRARYWWPGAGGTVYYRDSPDANSGPTGQIAFYGLSNYTSNPAAYNSTVFISTPLTTDRYGDIFFGFVVTGSNPLSLQSGIARISYTGSGIWATATSLAGNDAGITHVQMNCAPAVTLDGLTVYVAVAADGGAGYLASASATTLAPIANVRLMDPASGSTATVDDDSSAAPTIGPDGDVYFGVLSSSIADHHARGWLLHFDKTLATPKTPGSFGWDTTASIVAKALVPSYQGSSSYLVLTKYNNYIEVGGDGMNRVAVLDPNGTEPDPIFPGVSVMKEVMTVLGPTPNSQGGVQEWCINSAVIDIPNKSAIVNSEDGNVYRWSFPTNTLSQVLRLTAGIGEAYTPTVIGPDGTVYAINDAVLFAVTSH